MKIAAILTVVCFAVTVAPLTQPAQSATLAVISDFDSSGFTYTYGTWSGQTFTGPSYLTVGGTATGSGGGGINVTESAAPTDYIHLTARLGAGNLENEVQVILRDQDASGTEEYRYDFATSLFNSSTFTTVWVQISDYTSYSVQSGTPDGIINFTGGELIRGIIQGDFAAATAFNMEFDRFEINDSPVVPEPASTALLITGLALIRIYRRRLPA